MGNLLTSGKIDDYIEMLIFNAYLSLPSEDHNPFCEQAKNYFRFKFNPNETEKLTCDGDENVKNYIDQFLDKQKTVIIPNPGFGESCDVKKYLEAHGIAKMFKMMTCMLLFHLPDKPLDFLIQKNT